jgi:PBSX family phage terminase large subunit
VAKHLTEKQKKKIILDHVEMKNYSAVAKKHEISANTVKNIVLADKDFAEKCDLKKEEFESEILCELDKRKYKVLEFFDSGLDRMIDLLKTSKDIKGIGTAIGIMIDKSTKKKDYDLKEWELDFKRGEFELKKKLAEKENIGEQNIFNGYNFIPSHSIGKSFVDIYRDILNRNHRFYNFKGGRGSLKSSFCSLVFIDEIMRNKNFCAIALRQVKDTLKDSVYAQIVWAIEELGLSELFECTTSPMRIRKIDTGQIIYFRGADSPVKIKSIKPPNGMHIGVVWFEEKDQFNGNEAIRNIQQSVMRGGDDIIILSSYNTPISQQHFLNKNELVPDDKAIIHHSHYYDAPREWLGQPFFDDAEFLKQTNEKAYRHEYLGEPVGTGGSVFENVIAETITDNQIKSFDRLYYGLDWGYFPDPAHFAEMHYDAAKRELYIFGEVRKYKTRNENLGIALSKYKKDKIFADSSEPKSISDFRSYGFYVLGVEKYKGCVERSMQWLQGLNKIVIDPKRCPHTAKEFLEYEYDKARTGEIISGYPDKNNHAIDSVRYAMDQVYKRRGS